MTNKEKAKELASLLVGEDQNQEPLVEVLMEMAQWKKQQTVNKACEWLKHRGCLYIKYTEAGTGFDDERFIKDFKKAMEG